MKLADYLYGGGSLSAPSPEACSPAPPEGTDEFIAEMREKLRAKQQLEEALAITAIED